MAVPGSSTSSFVSSSHSAPTAYAQYTSPTGSAWTPNSAISPLTSESSGPETPLRPLDLGPPGYHATIILFEQTPNESTIYLGPWEVIGTDPPRVVWRCSYEGEVLEHYLPSDSPADTHPYTLHAQHRRFGDPRELELYLTFKGPQRVRYETPEGVFLDDYMEVKYEFTTIESSIQFQGDVRRRDLVDWFDVDVIWSDTHGRTDNYGNVRGLGTIQRMKIWRDRYSTFHYISFFANHRRRWKEYLVNDFEPAVRQRDDRHRRLRLQARGSRRGSAPDTSNQGRRFSATSIFRPRQASATIAAQAGPSTVAAQPVSGLDVRYLGIQFTRNERMQQGTDEKVILSVNAGSSSVKISVFTTSKGRDPKQIAELQVSGLTSPPPKLDYKRGSTSVVKSQDVEGKIESQDDAFSLLLQTLIDDQELPNIKEKDHIAVVTHRIVHGGDFNNQEIITPDTYNKIEELNDLAPLHNAKSLEIVKSCIKKLPSAINVACFDSQFHSTLPDHIRTYPIDQSIAKSNRLRKYGFHGISYAFITRSVADFLGKSASETNIIALHLGSGASACAIKGGKSWDTSMGLTPLAGLPGATRSGSVDPSLVFHYASDVGRLSPASTKELHISRAEEILNKESGWKSLTGTTNFGTIAASSDPTHKLAFDLFVDRICGFVGTYYVTLRGQVDALVFAGGIGEKSERLRAAVVEQCQCLGFEIDEGRNGKKIEGVVQDVGREGAPHRVLVCQTDEQFEMARAVAEDEKIWREDGMKN
ncbi:acetate kinase [Coniochaeta sp. PMI_546]|nr:acetate kinase [Coniochaeta sp. PMI_546]